MIPAQHLHKKFNDGTSSCYCANVLRISEWFDKLGFPMGGAYLYEDIFRGL